MNLREEITPGEDDSAFFPLQDYRWWWRNFLVSGGSAFYVLVYAIFYFVNKVRPCVRRPPALSAPAGGEEGVGEKPKCLSLSCHEWGEPKPFCSRACIFLGQRGSVFCVF